MKIIALLSLLVFFSTQLLAENPSWIKNVPSSCLFVAESCGVIDLKGNQQPPKALDSTQRICLGGSCSTILDGAQNRNLEFPKLYMLLPAAVMTLEKKCSVLKADVEKRKKCLGIHPDLKTGVKPIASNLACDDCGANDLICERLSDKKLNCQDGIYIKSSQGNAALAEIERGNVKETDDNAGLAIPPTLNGKSTKQ